MDKNFSKKITWMSFLANILILLEHANLDIDNQPVQLHRLMDFFSMLASPTMGWFFFTTAYFFFRRIKSVENIKKQINKRIYSLLLPYVIWNTFGMVLHIIGGEYTGGISVWQLIRNNYIFYGGTGCGNGPLWYIARLFTFFCLAPVIFYINRKTRLRDFFVLEIVIIAINGQLRTNNYDFIFFLPFFLAGAYIGQVYSEPFEEYIGNKNKNAVKVFLALAFIIIISELKSSIKNCMIPEVYRVVSLVLIFISLSNLGEVSKPRDFVYNSGMYLYCAHDIIYRIVRVVLNNVSTDTRLLQIKFLVVSFSLLFLGWALMSRYTPRLLHALSGGRNSRKLREPPEERKRV